MLVYSTVIMIHYDIQYYTICNLSMNFNDPLLGGQSDTGLSQFCKCWVNDAETDSIADRMLMELQLWISVTSMV